MPLDGVAAIIGSLDWTGGLSERMVAVLYGYFDDSGTDAASPVAVMAGYVASEKMWRRFERDTKRLFDSEGIKFFRAKLFDHGQKQFKGWSDARKLRFATEWFESAHKFLLRGASGAILKSDHKEVKAKHRKASSISDQSTCMSIVMHMLCEDGLVWSNIKRHNLSLVVEKSGTADEGIRLGLDNLALANDELEAALKSVTFANKEDVRALQLADFLAYYSFKLGLTARHDSAAGGTEFLNIALRAVPTLKNMAFDFAPSPAFAPALAKGKRRRKEADSGEG
jgi:hypothetical protein